MNHFGGSINLCHLNMAPYWVNYVSHIIFAACLKKLSSWILVHSIHN